MNVTICYSTVAKVVLLRRWGSGGLKGGVGGRKAGAGVLRRWGGDCRGIDER